MKKISFVVLLFVFVCLCGLVTAEAVYEKPILFRGIEWGTSYNEVVETYPNKNQNEWEPGGIEAIFYGGEATHYGKVGFRIRSGLPQGVTVAGYDVNDIYLNFVYTPDETGRLTKDKDHAVLCLAEYEFDFGSKKESYDAALEDLTNKLTLLFGDSDNQPSSGYGTRAVWKGAEGTLVSLNCRRGSYLNGGYYYRIYINYSFEGMETLLQDAKKALDMEFSFITDGL